MRIDAAPVIDLLERVTVKMRELGVDRFQFDLPVPAEDGEVQGQKLYAVIELGPPPLPPNAEEDEHVQRLRDHSELDAMRREERRRFAASSRISSQNTFTPPRRR